MKSFYVAKNILKSKNKCDCLFFPSEMPFIREINQQKSMNNKKYFYPMDFF